MKKTKILMVCLGNICRSPLAEGILRKKLPADRFEVDSAGTAGYHIGQAPDLRAQAIGRRFATDISGLKGRKFTVEDFDRFDIIYAMDRENFEDLSALARTKADRDKIKMIAEELYPGENLPVPDPYYGGEQGFENVYRMLDEITDIISKRLLDENEPEA